MGPDDEANGRRILPPPARGSGIIPGSSPAGPRDCRPVAEKYRMQTPSERYLYALCRRSFLSMWSFTSLYRDQGRYQGRGQGKELCDLMVVFEDHVIIFSDKHCKFPRTADLATDWSRWFRRAIWKSSRQAWGAARWIQSFPDRVYLDGKCTRPLPIAIPSSDRLTLHLIVVAHDSTERCREELGGSGSLMIIPSVVGRDHFDRGISRVVPFSVGILDPSRYFIHVLDDFTLEVLLSTLDTISDFTAYLAKKEALIAEGRLLSAAGEEDLLALYLQHLNDAGEHDFVVPDTAQGIVVLEGPWDDFTMSAQRRAQLEANELSYAWDALIEKFSLHIITGTQHFATDPSIRAQEPMIRFLAREPRTRRRMLGRALCDMIATTPDDKNRLRVIVPSKIGDPYYVFILLPKPDFLSEEEYRTARKNYLEACCMVTKLRFPNAKDIVGIATETGSVARRSEDAIHMDASEWTPAMAAEAVALQRELSILTDPSKFEGTEYEYPLLAEAPGSHPLPWVPKHYPRNRPCPCGSGRKFKACHGRKSQGREQSGRRRSQ